MFASESVAGEAGSWVAEFAESAKKPASKSVNHEFRAQKKYTGASFVCRK